MQIANNIRIQQTTINSESSQKPPSSIKLFCLVLFILLSFEQIIIYQISIVTHPSSHDVGGHFRGVIHCGRTVNFDQPNSILLINHKIESKNLLSILPADDILLHTFKSLNCDSIHLGSNL